MELKHIVGLVVLCTLLFLLFTAGGKNDYKKSSSWFKNCIPIPFIGHKICLQPNEGRKRGPKSKGGSTTNSGTGADGDNNAQKRNDIRYRGGGPSGGRGRGLGGGRGRGHSGGRGRGLGGGRGRGHRGGDRKICIHHDQVLDLTRKMIRITNNTREKHKYLFSKYDDRNFNKQWISNITESANQLHGIVNNRRNVERRAGKYFVCFSYESLRNLWSQIDETLEQIEYYIEERKQNGAPSTMTDKKNQRRFELFFSDVMLLIRYNNNIVRILNNADDYNLPTKQST